MRHLEERIAAWRDAGERVLVGFDFPFGFPAGFAAGLGEVDWLGTWRRLDALIRDDEENRNNRFDVAGELNRLLSGGPEPFWGCPASRAGATLSPRCVGFAGLPARRAIERRVPSAQPGWKLYTTGSVGGQALTGIPVLHRLRARLGATVWPFETGLTVPRQPLVFAEVYPSLVRPDARAGEPKDAGQVRALAAALAAWDASGELAALFAGDPGLTGEERSAVVAEEGWILGVSGPVRRQTR